MTGEGLGLSNQLFGLCSPEPLNPAIWSETPHDIQLHILTLLPLTSLGRFRCVSRAWHSATASIITLASPEPWFITVHQKEEFWICNGSACWAKFPLGVDIPWVCGMSTSGGLVLTTSRNSLLVGCESLLTVHNPLVSTCVRQLEHTPASFLVDLVVFCGIQALGTPDPASGKGAFAVVCITCSISEASMHVYDSRSRSWVLESVPFAGFREADEVLFCGAPSQNTLLLHDQRLYYLTATRDNTRFLKSVSIWDPEHTCETLAAWTRLPLDLHFGDFSEHYGEMHASLIFSQGRLVLVNIMRSPRNKAIGFVYLDQKAGRWRELKSIPMRVFPGKLRRKFARLPTAEPGCVIAEGCPESSKVALVFMEGKPWRCVLDLADSSWRPEFSFKNGSYMSFLLSFQPSFLTF